MGCSAATISARCAYSVLPLLGAVVELFRKTRDRRAARHKPLGLNAEFKRTRVSRGAASTASGSRRVAIMKLNAAQQCGRRKPAAPHAKTKAQGDPSNRDTVPTSCYHRRERHR